MNLLRIVLWITHVFDVLLSATSRRNSGLPIRKQTELFRLLSAVFFSSYINYYYLIYIYINRLSCSSLKAFNRKSRNNSDSHPFWSFVLLFSGSKNVKLKDFSRPSASPRPANPAINPLIESFFKTNLPISGVYSWLQKPCRITARLSLLPSPPPPNPRDMQAIRSLGRVSAFCSFKGSQVSSLLFPRLRFNPMLSFFYKCSCDRTFYCKGAVL